jgi:hypothetical protein
MMSARIILILADTLELIGTTMIAYAALRVNYRFRHEHKVDEKVFAEMTREHRIALIGLALLFAGYILHLIHNVSL